MFWQLLQKEVLHFLNTLMVLFVTLDPFAVVPIYLMLTDRFSPEMLAHTRKKAIIIASSILVIFCLTGLSIFKIFGITLPAFQIAGGALLFLLGFAQLNANRVRVKPEEESEGFERTDVSVFPLGTPLLAGPGAISTVVLVASQAHGVLRMITLLLAILCATGIVYFVLKIAHFLYQFLGRTGLNIITRMMGILLVAEAVQFIINGIEGAIKATQVIH